MPADNCASGAKANRSEPPSANASSASGGRQRLRLLGALPASIEGRSSRFVPTSDSGNTCTFHFCPDCGTTVYREPGGHPERITVAAGTFTDPQFPPPRHFVYDSRKHGWLEVPGNIEHL